MAILIDAESRILVQGPMCPALQRPISRRPFYAAQVVARVDVDPGGLALANLRLSGGAPAFACVREAVAVTGANVSLVVAPPERVADAVFEAVDAGIPLVVVQAEDVPPADRPRIRARLAGSGTRLLGPGCPGIVTPGGAQLGLAPSYVYARGSIGILSHSVVLAHEAAWQTTAVGLGQSTVASLGRRQIAAEAFGDCLTLFLADPATAAVVVVLDPRERVEGRLASALARRICGKPVVAHVVAPAGPPAADSPAGPPASDNVVGFAPAAAARPAAILKDAGAIIAETPMRIGQILAATIQTPAVQTPAHAWPQTAATRDFASAIRRVEREIYGPVLRVVAHGEEPQIST